MWSTHQYLTTEPAGKQEKGRAQGKKEEAKGRQEQARLACSLSGVMAAMVKWFTVSCCEVQV
jgi:hypothetical protein